MISNDVGANDPLKALGKLKGELQCNCFYLNQIVNILTKRIEIASIFMQF